MRLIDWIFKKQTEVEPPKTKYDLISNLKALLYCRMMKKYKRVPKKPFTNGDLDKILLTIYVLQNLPREYDKEIEEIIKRGTTNDSKRI